MARDGSRKKNQVSQRSEKREQIRQALQKKGEEALTVERVRVEHLPYAKPFLVLGAVSFCLSAWYLGVLWSRSFTWYLLMLPVYIWLPLRRWMEWSANVGMAYTLWQLSAEHYHGMRERMWAMLIALATCWFGVQLIINSYCLLVQCRPKYAQARSLLSDAKLREAIAPEERGGASDPGQTFGSVKRKVAS